MIWKKIRPYILHLRPLSFFIVFFHMFTGFMLGILMFNVTIDFFKVVLGFFTFVVLGNGATLALNSYYDRDKSPIGFLNKLPRMPKNLDKFAYLIGIIGLILSFFVNLRFALTYTICLALAILYSAPPLRFKEKAGFDILVNCLGYGVLTMYSGYSLVNSDLTSQMVIIFFLVFFLWAAGFPLTQIYHVKEDKERGFKTLAILLGKKGSILFSMILSCLNLAIVLISFYLGYFPKKVFILIPIYIIGFAFLINWFLKLDKADEKIEMYKGYFLVLLYDFFLILAFF